LTSGPDGHNFNLLIFTEQAQDSYGLAEIFVTVQQRSIRVVSEESESTLTSAHLDQQ
jgi:hypothetical protein